MKAITVRQPWAEAIAHEIKLVENRGQGFPKKYRGPLLLHAGFHWSTRGQKDDRIRSAWHPPFATHVPRGTYADLDFAVRHGLAHRGFPPHPFAAGAVLAVMHVVDIHPASGCCQPWGEETYEPANSEDRPPGRVTHLILEDVHRLLRPVSASGRLGLWAPDADLLAAVEAAK